MLHRDTSVAIKQDTNQALNATQGNKHSFQTSFNQTLNATQEHKHSLQTRF